MSATAEVGEIALLNLFLKPLVGLTVSCVCDLQNNAMPSSSRVSSHTFTNAQIQRSVYIKLGTLPLTSERVLLNLKTFVASLSFTDHRTTKNNNTRNNYCFLYQQKTINPYDLLISISVAFILVDGGWSEWSQWSLCTKTVNGIQIKNRECVNPKPKYGGTNCSGHQVVLRECRNMSSCHEGTGILCFLQNC